MELDDQLAALAAGELDADTARALRARAAADAALAQRLARHERLHELLTTWEAPPLSDGAVARIDAAVDDALDALGDEPLAERPTPTGPLRAVDTPRSTSRDVAASRPAAAGGQVVDLGAARLRRGLPAWVPAAAVAAALFAVVGTGIVGGFGSGDDTAMDMADAPTSESAEEDSDDVTAADGGSDDAADELAEDSALAPTEPDDVVLAEGELLALLDVVGGSDTTAAQGDREETADDEAASADEAAGTSVEPDACVVEALERDTAEAAGREVAFLARGLYADQPAQFVVIRTPADDGERLEVLAYDPDDCSLLARDETVR